jgi:hypothetical protein
MIEGKFDSKIMAAMEVALDRACEKAPHGEQHSVRKRIATKIIRCARSGKTTLAELTDAGQRALHELSINSRQSFRVGTVPYHCGHDQPPHRRSR